MDMPNPTAYYLFTPVEVNSPELEQKIIDELQATMPDYIGFTSRTMSEFGVKGFGADYGLRVTAWVNSAYFPEHTFRGPDGTTWRLLLMRRREPPLPPQ